MSRIIVKNLPDKVDLNALRQKFSEFGTVTDIQLKYTSSGKFRKFCFVGYNKNEEAEEAINKLNKSYIATSKIQVELCAEIGDGNKPKSWSKYAPDSTAYKKINEELNPPPKEKSVKKLITSKGPIRDEKIIEEIKKRKDDPDFLEFLELHGKADLVKKVIEADSGVEGGSDDESASPNVNETKVADNEALTDMEYLKLKMKGTDEIEKEALVSKKHNSAVKLFTLKISNLPFNVKKKDVKELLRPLKPASVRLPKKGFAYVGFETTKEMRQALVKNKTFLNGKQIMIHESNSAQSSASKPPTWQEQEEALKSEETIAESGRIFVRNLAYTVAEAEITEKFSKFGPISEVVFPICKTSRQTKGYCIVTFLMPEHAVAAYSSLDGTILHGRMLHLLPGKPNTPEEEENEDMSFNEKKKKKLKALAGSSHSWNSLFLDMNAVAEVIADKYNVSKEDVLSGKDAAVRVALAETQIVTETRRFLTDNGVKLDAFNQEPKKRSNTIILVKNLPAKTTVPEIRDLFSKYGELGRVLLPPNGVTGLVEFLEPSEARAAFKQLAYTRFKYLPLYLEWAPDSSWGPKLEVEERGENKDDLKEENSENKEEEPEAEMEAEPNATLFVKNLNFDTTEDELKKHFKSCGKIAHVTIAKKKDLKRPGGLLSMGYGFVHFFSETSVNEAIKRLQGSKLTDHALELKKSNRTLPEAYVTARKMTNMKDQTGTKILVRNIPFQATQKEIYDLFKTFGELKFVRLPKKLVGTGSHRGFAFVEFITKADAKRAMETLGQSTHLLGRRLVLEWAEIEEDVSVIRKRTAMHFSEESAKKSRKAMADVMKGPPRDEEEDVIDDLPDAV